MGIDNQQKSLLNIILDIFNDKRLMSLLIGLFVFVLFAVLFHFKVLDSFELITLETRFKHFHSQAKASDDCIIVGIDKKSVEDLGDSQWSNSVYAELIEALEFYGVKTISFDLFFSIEKKTHPEGNKLFADVISKYENIVLASPIVNELKSLKTEKASKQLKNFSLNAKNKLDSVSVQANYVDVLSENDRKSSDYIIMPLLPYPALLSVVKSLGIISFASEGSEKSSKIFQVPLVFSFEDSFYSSLSLESYLVGINDNSVSQSGRSITFSDGLSVPTVDNNMYVVNWYPAKDDRGKLYRTIPVSLFVNAYSALKRIEKEHGYTLTDIQDSIDYYYSNNCDSSNSCDPEKIKVKLLIDDETEYEFVRKELKGKFAFVGLIDTYVGSKDLVKTPLLGTIPGVYMHANIVDNFLHKNFIEKTSPFLTLIIMFMLILATTITILNIKNSVIGVFASLLYLLYFLVPLFLFEYFNIWADLFYTELSIVFAFGLSLAYQWRIADKDKKLMKSVFSNYLAPQVLTEVLSDPSKVKMGGNRKNITILFSDIRGFTTISENNTPEGVVEFLNEYLEAMVEEVLKTDGTVDKFIGDAVMAFWGAPVERENHAELAVRCSLGMLEALESIKKRWKEQGRDIPDINIGIGLNTGDAIVGHVGSSKLKSYTVIGDSVNLASRLEGLNKNYDSNDVKGKSLIISEFTYEHVKDIFDVLYLDEVKVKGKNIAVKIYKVLGYKGD
ncbi:MAG: adenylate/guanylate cyclase domain-containing protein [Vampirovibrionia bacterium]